MRAWFQNILDLRKSFLSFRFTREQKKKAEEEEEEEAEKEEP